MQVSKIKTDLLRNSHYKLQEYENAGYKQCKRNEAQLKVTIKAYDGQKTYYLKK